MCPGIRCRGTGPGSGNSEPNIPVRYKGGMATWAGKHSNANTQLLRSPTPAPAQYRTLHPMLASSDKGPPAFYDRAYLSPTIEPASPSTSKWLSACECAQHRCMPGRVVPSACSGTPAPPRLATANRAVRGCQLSACPRLRTAWPGFLLYARRHANSLEALGDDGTVCACAAPVPLPRAHQQRHIFIIKN